MHDDDEVAEQMLALVEGDGDPRDRPPVDRTLRGYDEHVELLTSIQDSLRSLHATLIAANSKNGKGPDVTPTTRPRTAMDRAFRRRDLAVAEDVRQKFAPREIA